MSKRVLIITYYWPPSAGSGVQRWLKFAKYLPEFGWDPVIFTPENPDFDLKDPGLEKEIPKNVEVLKFPIWEPYDLFRKVKNQRENPAKILEKRKKSWRDLAAIWLRANALIPDPRIFWKKPAVGFLLDLMKNGQFDAIITTGPPHSIHLIGLELKRKTGITWLADFRDPWSTWEFLDTLPMVDWVKQRHQKLEKQVLSQADVVTTISPTFQSDLEAIGERKVDLLTNGFDESDLPHPWPHTPESEEPIEILYTGVIDSIRNPTPFLLAFKKVFENEKKNVLLRFVGLVSEGVQESVKNDPWLSSHVVFEGYISHQAVFEYYKKSHLLLLILTDTKNAKGNIPGKLFEYMATGRPIIALGDPEGDAAKILAEAHVGKVFAHTDFTEIEAFLSAFEPNAANSDPASIHQYSRKALTQRLTELIDAKTRSIS
ncbi:glycosyltransferase family 4 protein [Mariniradius sediminis]|uniref:Glycosyltransferase family 4 protein n=1 Tax=Mariniradius sediminis TaxID=2909237 RepID=A0ABS9BYN2_9BACT|nr:glycosyltransferase family 4 protein [Mariniradius sediminis]MCF1752562.1 glycosyltransferase family 4 protein [Mariniradius sediminis]